MADSVRFKDWYNKASKDFNAAKILFEHEGDYSLVAFHCQQAIEKTLKGYILENTHKLVDGHSLVYLCRQVNNFDTNIRSFLKDCAYVNQFYIETRYPADLPSELDKEDAGECIDIADKLINYIINRQQIIN